MKRELKKYLGDWLIVGLLILAFIVYSQVYYIYAETDLVKIWFLDVGQGDAILVDFGDNQQMLIDGGPDKTVLSHLGQHLPMGDRTIEHLLLTHPHSDHVTGLNYVLDEYQVENVYYTGLNYDTNRYQQFREKIKGTNKHITGFGDVIDLNNQAKFKVIYPDQSYNKRDVVNPNNTKINNTSIVGILSIGQVRVLMTGDGEVEVWQDLSEKRRLSRVEVLKVSHHGAANGTTEVLLEQTRPQVGVISAGENNRYGHPSQDTLDLLDIYNVKVYRTDTMGTIKMVSDGRDYWFK